MLRCQGGNDDDKIGYSSSNIDIEDAAAAVIQLLHVNTTNLHISCGAKFGCDYLLYDGPRSERHAFAGLHIVPQQDDSNSSDTAVNAYSLTSYVRCLNSAGKLALLATTRKVNSCPASSDGKLIGNTCFINVSIVDLRLEKIVETTFKKPIKSMEERLKNLSKR